MVPVLSFVFESLELMKITRYQMNILEEHLDTLFRTLRNPLDSQTNLLPKIHEES